MNVPTLRAASVPTTCIADRLSAHLGHSGVPYEILHRAPARARVVLGRIDGRPAFLVVPHGQRPDLHRLRDALRAQAVELAADQEMRHLCPDCDAGEVPPVGALYGVPVYMSLALADTDYVTFPSGRRGKTIRVRYRDFRRLTRAQVVDFTA